MKVFVYVAHSVWGSSLSVLLCCCATPHL